MFMAFCFAFIIVSFQKNTFLNLINYRVKRLSMRQIYNYRSILISIALMNNDK